MSSVQEKNSRKFRNLLIRQASLDKIKCTAYTTIGSIISKKSSLIHALENAMNSSRAVVQVPVLTIVIPSVHIICVAMSLLGALIRRHYAGQISLEHLDQFIIDLNQLKSARRQSIQKQQQQQQQEAIVSDTREAQEDCSRRSSTHSHEQVFHNADAATAAKRRDNLLTIASFASIAFVHIQLSLLLYLIGLSSLKLGMLFMLICITAIAYFTLKISFTMRLSRERRRNGSKSLSQRLIGKALTLRQITCVLPQLSLDSCGGGRFSGKKPKSS